MVEQFGLRERSNSNDSVHNLDVGDDDRNKKSIEMLPLTFGNNNNNGVDSNWGAEKHSLGDSTDGIPKAENDFDDEKAGRKNTEKSWNLRVQNWLYPPQLPPELQLLRKENIAIPACYLLVGILQGLSGPLINVYPLDLNATEAQQTTISTLKSLPASLKLIFGFVSDNFPILGYRRKSYMMIGWGLAAFSYGFLVLTTDLTLSEETYEKDDGSMGTTTIAPINAPSIPFLCLMTFLYGAGEYRRLFSFILVSHTHTNAQT